MPHHSSAALSLQILGFFKGMSFPLASIAVVNSVLFGVYSNALLVLTATSHQERRVQPPSYTHVFIAGCTGGFLQVRGRRGAHVHTHAHTDQVMVCSFLPLPGLCGHPQLRTWPSLLAHEGLWGSGQLLLLPMTWPGQGRPSMLGAYRQKAVESRESSGRGWAAGDGARGTPWRSSPWPTLGCTGLARLRRGLPTWGLWEDLSEVTFHPGQLTAPRSSEPSGEPLMWSWYAPAHRSRRASPGH